MTKEEIKEYKEYIKNLSETQLKKRMLLNDARMRCSEDIHIRANMALQMSFIMEELDKRQ